MGDGTFSKVGLSCPHLNIVFSAGELCLILQKSAARCYLLDTISQLQVRINSVTKTSPCPLKIRDMLLQSHS